MNRLSYLTGFAEGAALNVPDSDFEQQHLQDVLKHMDALAEERQLDFYLCRLIALGHDLGRTKLGVYGKGHTKASAKWMKTYLKESELSSKQKRRVVRAIRKHNKKHKFHDAYSEAIKDADTLAHYDEQLMEGQDLCEQYRLLALQSKPIAIIAAITDQWQLQMDALLDDLAQTLESELLFDKDPGLWVHRIRILARKLRSMLWVVKQVEAVGDKKTLESIDSRLRKMAQSLSRPRLLLVACQKIGEQHSAYEALHSELLSCYEVLRASEWLKESLYSIQKDIQGINMAVCEQYLLDGIVKQMLAMYLKDITSKKILKPEPLHRLRISGKRIAYLTDLELIQVEPASLVNAVYSLHRLIGKHRDLLDIEALLKEKTCSKTMKSLEQAISAELFLIKKINTD